MKKMTNRANWRRRILSVILTVVMLVGTMTVGLTGLVLYASAVSVKAASVTMSDLTFVVPEAIYLYPNATAWKDTTSTLFQYYINNSNTGAVLQNQKDSTGKIYINYSDFSGKATLSYSFVDGNFDGLTGGDVTLSKSSDISSGDTINITGGYSPSLSAATTGCYILWTLSFKDSKDNTNKTAYALTYVYKPYTVPAGVLLDDKNSKKDFWNKQISWMVGFHGMTDGNSGNGDGLYYPYYTGSWGLAVFASSDNTGFIDGNVVTNGSNSIQRDISSYATTDNTNDNSNGEVKKALATRWYMLFSNTATSTYHFREPIVNGNNNPDEQNWFKTSNDPNSTYPYPFVQGDDTDKKENQTQTATARYRGTITIDTSRYTNLAYIPNLSLGLMVCSDENSHSGGSWYVADMTDKLWNGSQARLGNIYIYDSGNAQNYLDMKNYVIAGQYKDRTTMNWGETEGVRYAGPWYRPIISGNTKEYIAHTMYGNRYTTDNWYMFTHGEISLHATQYDKTSLRTAVQNALKKFPALGVNGISSGITSCYFDADSNYKWQAFVDAYAEAYKALTKVDGTITDPGTLATKLNNALAALCTRVNYDYNGGTVTGVSNPSYVTIGANQTATVTPGGTGTKYGYDFKGWNLDKNATTGSTSVTVGYNNTVYAIWQPKSYSISYTLNGGTVSGNPTSYTIETSPVRLNNPTKTGYTFTGWTGSNGSTPQTDVTVPNGVSSGLSGYTTSNPYVAQYRDHHFGNSFSVQSGATYRIFVTAKRISGTLNMQGGIWYTSSTSGAPYDGYSGEFARLRDLSDGWAVYYKDVTVPDGKLAGQFYAQINQDHDGGDTVWHLADCAVVRLNLGNLSYTANWQANTYTVTYNGNGATGGSTASSSHTYDVAKNLTANGFNRIHTVTYNYNYTGSTDGSATATATFNGWATSANGAKVYNNSQSVVNLTATNGVTVPLFANWTLASVTLPAATRTGYRFDGWYDAATGGTKIGNAGAAYTPAADKTLYAHWVKQYYIDLNGWINGQASGSLKDLDTDTFSWGTADVYVNGVCVANDVIDFYQAYDEGTAYEIKDIKGTPGYDYVGPHSDVGTWNSDPITGTLHDVGRGNVGAFVVLEFAKIVKNDVYVLDFGLGAKLNVLANDISGATLSTVPAGTENYSLEKADNQISFIPLKPMSEPIVFDYTVTYKGSAYTATATVIPANNVYYEDSFFDFTDESGVAWKKEGTTGSAVQAAVEAAQDSVDLYGSDAAYATSTTYSLGSAMYAEVSPANKTASKATFTFTGTGFDLYAVTSGATGLTTVIIEKLENGAPTTVAQNLVNTYYGYNYGRLYLKDGKVTLDSSGTPIYYAPAGKTDGTFFIRGTVRGQTAKSYYASEKVVKDGAGTEATAAYAYGWVAGTPAAGSPAGIYQVPVISKTGLAYGTYRVTIQPRYSAKQDLTGQGKYRFYIDSVRVYDPLNPASLGAAATAAYQGDNEYGAQFVELRDQLITAPKTPNLTGGSLEGIAFLENKETETGKTSLQSYAEVGPKNEIYLAAGQAIAFTLTTSDGNKPAKLSLGMKLLTGGTGNVTVTGSKGSVSFTLNNVTDLYRDISAAVNWSATGSSTFTAGTVTITNSGTSAVSLTKLKWSYGAPAAATQAAFAPKMLRFSVSQADLDFAGAAFDAINTEQTTASSEGVTVTWDNETLEIGGTATLTITAPATFEKAFKDGNEIAGYTELPDGSRQWTVTVTVEELGEYTCDVTLEDENGYRTKAISAGSFTVVPPAEPETDPANGTDGSTDGNANGASRRWSFYDLLQAIINFFRRIVSFFKSAVA